VALSQQGEKIMGQNIPDAPYRYKIEIGGLSNVRFTEAQGIKATTALETYREGGNNQFEHAMIGPQTYEPLVIKKGFYSPGSEFFIWMKELHIASKKVKRQDISLIILNDKFEETGRYNFYGCFPVEYEGPAFNSTAKDIAFESIKIRYDYFIYHPGSALAGLFDAVRQKASDITGFGS
jgi:phage tail-like protein